jgi:hypothetical protein
MRWLMSGSQRYPQWVLTIAPLCNIYLTWEYKALIRQLRLISQVTQRSNGEGVVLLSSG